MSTDLPYTYTDADFHRLHIVEGLLTITTPEMPSASVDQPTGDTAIEVARAVLDADGQTDQMILPESVYRHFERRAAEQGAMSMRDRAARVAVEPWGNTGPIVAEIRALPLLPEGDGPDDGPEVYRRLIDQVDQVLTDAGADRARHDRMWLAYRSAAARARRRQELIRELRRQVDISDGITAKVKALMERRTNTLRARAERAEGERDELRRALRSALSSPDTPGVHTTLAHMQRLAGLDDAPDRPDLVDLPAADMVEPGDEVPTLAEQADRLTAVEQRLDALEELTASQASLLEAHSRALEPSALGHAVSTPPPAPARYRDRRGDVWEDQGDGTLRAIAVHRDRADNLGTVLSHVSVEHHYGVLATMPAGGAE
ncbi:hypothetical protein [Nocardiopsis synnemataformans]|uniref:hypothetical protein n=1 Tax=Nocardiopsis synnemataformans TaxID=61305 RepID=UPI003EB948A9